MSHYFTDNRNLPTDRKEISFRFLGYDYIFVTDAGVFSKSEADEGSLYLTEKILEEDVNGELLDIGCGYGLISLVLKQRIPSLRVTGTDVNQRALDCANASAKKMNLEAVFLLSDGTAVLDTTFDTVVSNPPIRTGKATVYRLFQEAHDILQAGGAFYTVIRRQQGAASAKRELERIFGNVSVLYIKKGFEVLKSTKTVDKMAVV